MGFLFSIPSGLMLLAAGAAAIAGFMLWQGLRDGGLPGCGAGSGCDAVTSSRWAKWVHVPVAGPGMGLYVALAVAAFWTRPEASPGQQRVAWSVMLVLGMLAAGAAGWFIVLQALLIRRFCPYCMMLHGMGLVMGGGILWFAPMQSGAGSSVVGAMPSMGLLAGVAGVGVAVLIAGQVFFEPKTYAVSRPDQRTSEPEAALEKGEEPAVEAVSTKARMASAVPAPEPASPGPAAPIRPAPRRVSVYGGRVVLSSDKWPILGSPEARHILVELLDYTCPDCRHMNGLMSQVLERYGQQIAVLAVPVPLESSCNPLARPDPKHAGACQLARLALAVWMAGPEKFAAFHHWLFESERPRGVEEARRRAGELVGPAAIEAGLPDTRVVQHLRNAVGILEAAGGGKLPKVLLPEVVLWGRVPYVQDMFRVLEEQLELTPRSPHPAHARRGSDHPRTPADRGSSTGPP